MPDRRPFGGDEATLAEAWTHADGYSLVHRRDPVPEEIIEDVAALQSRLMLDAPTGDLAVEQELYDTDRVRGQEATQLGRGHRWYSTAARHDATGQIVARTAEAALAGVPRPAPATGDLLVCPWFRVGDQVIRTVAMVARFDHPAETTLDELRVELVYPTDGTAERYFRSMAATRTGP